MPTIQEVRQVFPQYDDLSDEQLLTGIHKKFYSDIPVEDFMSRFSSAPQQSAQPPQGGSALGTALGSVVSGGGGLLSTVGSLGGMVLPGVGYDNALTRAGRDVQQYGESLMSEEMRAKRAALSEAVKRAEDQGLVAEASAALRMLAQNPSLIGSMLLEQIPMFVATGGVGRAAMGAVQLGTRGAVRAAAAGAERQAAVEAAEQLAGRVGTGTAIGTGAALQGGEVAGQAYQDVMSLPDTTLANSPAYQALTQRMSAEEARRTLAEEAAQQAGLMGAGISGAAAALLPGAEKALFSKQLSERVVRRVLTGAAGEGAQEAIEEGGGQVAQNIAARRADTERDITRGAAGAAAIGGTLGAIMGGGIAGVRGPTPPPAEPRSPITQQLINDYVAGRDLPPEGIAAVENAIASGETLAPPAEPTTQAAAPVPPLLEAPPQQPLLEAPTQPPVTEAPTEPTTETDVTQPVTPVEQPVVEAAVPEQPTQQSLGRDQELAEAAGLDAEGNVNYERVAAVRQELGVPPTRWQDLPREDQERVLERLRQQDLSARDIPEVAQPVAEAAVPADVDLKEELRKARIAERRAERIIKQTTNPNTRAFAQAQLEQAQEARANAEGAIKAQEAAAAKEEQGRLRTAFKRADETINKRLGELEKMGTQGKEVADGVRRALNNRALDSQQLLGAFIGADVLVKQLPGKANHRIEFVERLLPTEEEAKAVEASGGTLGAEAQGRRDAARGLIELSLSKRFLDPGYVLLRETAAHEAFHVLQDYYKKFDKGFAQTLDNAFAKGSDLKDGKAMFADIIKDKSLKNKLQRLRSAAGNMSYFDLLVRDLKGPITPREAQAYVYGALVDSLRRGNQITGVKPGFSRFINFLRDFFSRMGNALSGVGYGTTSELLTREAGRGGARFTQELARPAQAAANAGAVEFSARLAPTDEQTIEFSARQTNMSVPEFKTWWEGGWRGPGYTPVQSAARTQSGQPIQYYHGTQKGFVRFGKARSGSIEGQEGPFFFSPDPDFSNQYAEMALYAGGKNAEVESGQRMLPVFLSVQNPFDSTLREFQKQLLDYVDRGLDDGSLTWRDLGTSSKPLSGETEAQTTRRKYSLFKRILTLEGVDNWKSMESNAAQKFLRENGFDGFFIIENGVKNLAVFDPRQIKSIFNQFAEGAATQPEFAARQSPLLTDPNYSFYMDALTAQPIARSGLFGGVFRRFVGAMDNTALYGTPNTPERLRDALVRTSVNRNHPIWMLQQLAERMGVLNGRDIGIAAESALMNTGRMQLLTQVGGLKFDPTTGDIDIRNDVKSLMEIFEGKVDTKNQDILQRYLIALREKDLRGVGRTGMRSIKGRPFTDQMINDIIQQTEQAHPEFVDIARDLKKFSDSLLDFAVDTGIMTRAKAQELALIFYTPFYREMEADSQSDPNQILGPNVNNVLRNTTSALDKKLGGGDGNVGDLLENILRNADSILRAGLKNHAIKMTAEVARDVGLGQVVQSAAGNNIVTYRVNGNEVHFRVDDPILFTAMATAPAKTRGALHQAMARMASFFREMITLAPSFMWANLYRGKFQAYAQEGASFSPFTTMKGMKDFLKANPSYLAFTAQTGFGGYTFGMGEKNIAAKMKKQLDDRGIFREVMRGNLWAVARRAIDGLSQVSEATELAERLGLYERLKAQGMTDKQAAFQAYMLAPFSRQGSGQGVFGNVVQSLIPLVPFLNAKIQGLYRLVENEKGNKTILKIPQQIFLRSMVITAFSTALYGLALSGGNEDELDNLTVDDIIRYDWLFLGEGRKIALPRNFEIGSFFGAVPILAMEAYRKGHTDDLTKAAVSIGTSTLFFNPIPQAVLPILSATTNYDFFRGRELENYAMRNLPTEDRVDRSTTTAARLASAATGNLVSPIKMQAVLNGYLGSIGSGLMSGFDSIVLANLDVIPGKPAGPFGSPSDIPAILGNASGLGRFYRTDETKVSRFVGDFYTLKEQSNQIKNAINEANLRGDYNRAIELQTEKGQLAMMNRTISRTSTQLSELNRQIRAIEAGPFDSETKLALIAPLRQQRDMMAKQTVQQARAMGAI